MSAALRPALEELEQHWRALGAPLERVLNAGLRPDEVRARVTAEFGGTHPDLEELWAWHDGSLFSLEWIAAPSGLIFLSLDEAVDTARLERRIKPDPASAGDPAFQTHWVPIFTGFRTLALDLQSGAVRVIDWHSARFTYIAADTLAEAIVAWNGALAEGTYAWNDDLDCWQATAVPLSRDLLVRGLAD